MIPEKPHIIDRSLDWLSTAPGQILLAGLIGGIIRWLSPGSGDWRARLLSLVSGAATAWYLAPPVSLFIAGLLGASPDNVQIVAGVAFFLGIGGISIVALIVELSKGLNNPTFIKSLVTAILDTIVHIITRGRGGPPPGGGTGGGSAT